MIAEIFTTWQERLVRYCAHLLGDRHEAEEVAQDVFAGLIADPDRYDLRERAEVLLFRMAHNRCVDARRRRRPHSNVDPEPAAEPAEPADDEQLAGALAQLPSDERETLLLTAVDGLGYREVAAILGCSLGTVAARRCAAIEKLRERLSR